MYLEDPGSPTVEVQQKKRPGFFNAKSLVMHMRLWKFYC